jgi:hypothetical protein
VLAGRADGEADAPGEPGGAGAEALPAAASIELADEVEEAGGGGVEMGTELGDLVAEALELGDAIRVGDDAWGPGLHGAPPSVLKRLYTPLSTASVNP